jgi:hypothetical protein
MFGLGHYIYAGEDLPQPEPTDHSEVIKQYSDGTKEQRDALWSSITPDQQVAINKSFEGK